MRKVLISVIVPAYKQEKTITRDLRRIKGVLNRLRHKTELICVVDGFADNTYDKALRFAKKHKNTKVIGYETNKGKGYAIRFGMAKARGNIIAFVDSGMDLNPNGLSMLLEHFEWYGADAIVGSKRHPASKVIYPWPRKILSMGYQILVAVFFGLKIRDTQVGMKFFRREVLEKVLPRLLVKTYAFDIEILAVAYSLGFKKIYEAPVEINLEFGNNSLVTGNKFYKTIFLILWDTMAVFYRLRLMHYYSDKNHRRWIFDPELNFRVNIG